MLKQITDEQLEEVLEEHYEFLFQTDRSEEHLTPKDLGLKTIDLRNYDLAGIEFIEKDLRGLSFAGSDLTDAKFLRCIIQDAYFNKAKCIEIKFLDCEMDHCNFREADCTNGAFLDCRMEGTMFYKADLTNTGFNWTNISGSNLQWVKIDKNANPLNFLNTICDNITGNELLKKWIEQQVYEASVIDNYLMHWAKKSKK